MIVPETTQDDLLPERHRQRLQQDPERGVGEPARHHEARVARPEGIGRIGGAGRARAGSRGISQARPPPPGAAGSARIANNRPPPPTRAGEPAAQVSPR